jgi:multiple sugar transport system substrate-binding protein
MQFTKNQKIILGVGGAIILFFVLVFVGIIPGLRKDMGHTVKLQLWGVSDDEVVWRDIISKYTASHSNVSVQYTKLNTSDYESKLVDALAAGQGPDIFMFNNSWLPKHKNKITPAPADIINIATFQKKLFPQVVVQDFTEGDVIYAMPLSVDTIALVYNRDIFDQRGVALPPSTWDEFKKVVLQTRSFSATGTLNKPAAAIGGTIKSITNATDLLNLIFMQTGTNMPGSASGQADFTSQKAVSALNFYVQFGKPGNKYYTWNDALGNDIDSFAAKKTAMVFAYAAQLQDIKSKNPFLNFAVQPVPQFDKDNAVNYANYWGLAVSAKSAHSSEAWDFINYITTNTEVAQSYAIATNKPPALRSLIAQYLTNPVFGPYAEQALTARSWAQPDPDAVSVIFNNMIQSALTRQLTTEQILQSAAGSINELIYK